MLDILHVNCLILASALVMITFPIVETEKLRFRELGLCAQCAYPHPYLFFPRHSMLPGYDNFLQSFDSLRNGEGSLFPLIVGPTSVS